MTEPSRGTEQKACVVVHPPTLAAGAGDTAPRGQARADRGLWEKAHLKVVVTLVDSGTRCRTICHLDCTHPSPPTAPVQRHPGSRAL